MPYAIIRVTDKGVHLSSHYKHKVAGFSVFKTTDEADAYGRKVYKDDKKWITVEVTEAQLRRLMRIKDTRLNPFSFPFDSLSGITDFMRGVGGVVYKSGEQVPHAFIINGKKYVAEDDKPKASHDLIHWYLDPSTPNTAYCQGRAARGVGLDSSKNPYIAGTPNCTIKHPAAFREWAYGWNERDRDENRKTP